MIYIYLNTYACGCMYVGSHKWSGEGIDPDYKGSSTIAKLHGWEPISIKILEVVTDARKFVAEREWIEKYCNMYGINAQVKGAAHRRGNYWVDKFGDGVMLNEHSNSAYQMHHNSMSADALAKRAKAREIWRNTAEGRATVLQNLAATKTPEALQAYSQARIASRNKYRLSDGFEGDYVDIADHIGVNYSTCRKWLNGQRSLPKRFGLYTAVLIPREARKDLVP